MWDVILLRHSSRTENVGSPRVVTAKAHTTTTTIGDIVWSLNYAETRPNTTLHYHASDMILHVASNASYLCEECARSRSGVHFPLSDQLFDDGKKTPTLLTNYRAIHTLCQLITVMSSVTEVEIGAIF